MNKKKEGKSLFLAYDGDKVGRKLESLLINNDESAIKAFAKKVQKNLTDLEQFLIELNCEIIFASGDSIFAKTDNEFNANDVTRDYGDVTFSLGVGNSPLEAMLALKKAKSKGIAECCYYSLDKIKE